MDGNVEKLISLLESDNCDYSECRRLIQEIGGTTKVICDGAGRTGMTTPLHEVVDLEHYEFALELIAETDGGLDVSTEDVPPLLADLRFLWSDGEERCREESRNKLRLVRALINKGANPNPSWEGDYLLDDIRYGISEGWAVQTDYFHYIQMEHIIEARLYGNTEVFFERLLENKVKCVMLSRIDLCPIDDNLADADYAIFILDNGERWHLSSYQTDDDKWEFFAYLINEDIRLSPEAHRTVEAWEGFMKFVHCESDFGSPTLDFSIDDALLRVTVEEMGLILGIVYRIEGAEEPPTRRKLFES